MRYRLAVLGLAVRLWGQNITPGRDPGPLDFFDPGLKAHNLRAYTAKAVILALIPEKDYSRNRVEGLNALQKRYAREGVQVLAAVLSSKRGLLERMRETAYPAEFPIGPITMEECKAFLGKDCDAASPHLLQFDRAGKLRDDQPFIVDQPDGLLISTLWAPAGTYLKSVPGAGASPAVSAKAQEFFRQLVSSEAIGAAQLLAAMKGLNVEAHPDFAIAAQRGALGADIPLSGASPLKLRVTVFRDGNVFRTDTVVKQQGGLTPFEATVRGDAQRLDLAVIYVDLSIEGFRLRETREVAVGELHVFSRRNVLTVEALSEDGLRQSVQSAVTKALSEARMASRPAQSSGAWRQIVGDASQAEKLWLSYGAAQPGSLLKGLTAARKVTGFSPGSVTRSGVEGAPDWIDEEVSVGRRLQNGMDLSGKLHVIELRIEDAFVRLGSMLYRTPATAYRLMDAAYFPMSDADNYLRASRAALASQQLRIHKQLDIDFPK